MASYPAVNKEAFCGWMVYSIIHSTLEPHRVGVDDGARWRIRSPQKHAADALIFVRLSRYTPVGRSFGMLLRYGAMAHLLRVLVHVVVTIRIIRAGSDVGLMGEKPVTLHHWRGYNDVDRNATLIRLDVTNLEDLPTFKRPIIEPYCSLGD